MLISDGGGGASHVAHSESHSDPAPTAPPDRIDRGDQPAPVAQHSESHAIAHEHDERPTDSPSQSHGASASRGEGHPPNADAARQLDAAQAAQTHADDLGRVLRGVHDPDARDAVRESREYARKKWADAQAAVENDLLKAAGNGPQRETAVASRTREITQSAPAGAQAPAVIEQAKQNALASLSVRDGLIANGVPPEITNDPSPTRLSAYVRDHPDVAAKLMANQPTGNGPDGSADRFLRSLDQPALSAAGTDVGALGRTRVRAFFNSMSPADQQRVAILYPSVVGNLSGVPFSARATANQIAAVDALSKQSTRIDATKAEIAATKAAIADDQRLNRGFRTGGGMNLKLAGLEAKLENQQAQQRLFQGIASSIGTPQPRQVLLFDPAHSRYAEMTGKLDGHTRNVGVMVPGTNTTLGSIDGNVQADDQFVKHDPNGDLAMITWMGGPLPQDIVTQAPLQGYSKDQAVPLAEFSKDLRQETQAVQTDGAAAKITVAGHSYGGAIVGLGEAHGLDADRVLHIESAGMGTGINSPSDLHPTNPNVQRYAMLAPGDLIGLSQGIEVGPLGHGASPEDFPGVTVLATGRYADNYGQPGNRDVIAGASAHGGVFKPGDAWNNMYEVFTGGVVTLQFPSPAHVVGPGGKAGSHVVPAKPLIQRDIA